MQDQEARDHVARVEALLEEVESFPDPVAREKTTEVAEALLALYGEGLARIVEHVASRDGGELAAAFADDEVVSHLLLLHGLHPLPLEQRVLQGLDEVRPYLESHGGNVELLGVEEGVVRLRLEGSCSGCPSSAMTLKLAIEDAIRKNAPDVEAVEADDAGDQPEKLLQLTVSDSLKGNGTAPSGTESAWIGVGPLPALQDGGLLVERVAGEAVLFAKVDGTVYAYRPSCPRCGESLEGAALTGVELGCDRCSHRYDARRAGRSVDGSEEHLEPIPLLADDAGEVKVALGAAVT